MFEKELKGFLCGIIAAFCTTLSAVIVKDIPTVPNAILVFSRYFICFLFMIPWLMKTRFTLKVNTFSPYFIRTIAGILSVYCFYYSAKNLPLVDSTLLRNTVPLFTPFVVLLWFKEKTSRLRLFTALLGFLGVAIVIRPSFDFFNLSAVIGLMSGLLASTSLVAVRKLSQTEGAEQIMFYFFTSSALIAFIPLVIYWQPIVVFNEWLHILLLGLVSFGFQYFITKAYIYVSPTRVSVMSYFSVIFGGLMGWFLWHQLPGSWTIVGSVIVALCSIYLILEKKVKETT